MLWSWFDFGAQRVALNRYIVKLQPRYPSKGNVGSAAMSAIGGKADIRHIGSDVR
jgi:hypothetical protein